MTKFFKNLAHHLRKNFGLSRWQHFNNALEYQKNSEVQMRLSASFMNRISPDKAANILDIGCGTGSIAAYFSKIAPFGRTYDIDISEEMIFYAQHIYSSLIYPNLNFLNMDAQDMSFENSQFDLIISSFSMHWLDEQQKVLGDICRFLKPEGQFEAVLPGEQAFYPFIKQVIESDPWNKKMTKVRYPHHIFTPASYQNMLQEDGFGHAEVKSTTVHYVFQSDEQYTGQTKLNHFFAGWSPFGKNDISEEEHEQFRHEVIDRYVKDSQKNADRIVLPGEYIFAHADSPAPCLQINPFAFSCSFS